jgi:hypothetical protein
MHKSFFFSVSCVDSSFERIIMIAPSDLFCVFLCLHNKFHILFSTCLKLVPHGTCRESWNRFFALYKQLRLQAYYIRCTRGLGGSYRPTIIEGVCSLCRVPQETKYHFVFMTVGLFVTAPESEIRTNTRRRQMRQFASQYIFR